jgi:hypothetical protein
MDGAPRTLDEDAAILADSSVALAQLGEFDELFSRVGDSDMIRSILKRDANLHDVLLETERRQDGIFESFIEQHCAQIQTLCDMFNEVSGCESKLLEFERSIASFQERLTTTSESVARMQAHTVQLRTRVANRREVSDKLKQVYEALHETGRFCDAIAGATVVDEAFLMSIRQLESKIAFLSDNEELIGSDIENEMLPKLTEAARKAGGKLHEFLVRKLSALAAENAVVAVHQQAIERTGQYAFSFLSKYNLAIAGEVTAYYTSIMTDVYARSASAALRAYRDAADAAMRRPFEPFVTADAVAAVRAQLAVLQQHHMLQLAAPGAPAPSAPTAAAGGAAQSGAAQSGAAGAGASGGASAAGAGQAGSVSGDSFAKFVDPRSLPIVNRAVPPEPPRKEKTFGESLRGFFGGGTKASDAAAPSAAAGAARRPAVFADYVYALQAVDATSGRSIAVDALLTQMLSKSACWVHHMTTMLFGLVNSVVSEGRFLNHFFFLALPANDREEAMLASIFAEPLGQAHDVIRTQLLTCNDPVALLAAHRVVEIAKNFVTQSCNPIPIMLLTAPLEGMFACISQRLAELVELLVENLRGFVAIAAPRRVVSSAPAPVASASAGAAASDISNAASVAQGSAPAAQAAAAGSSGAAGGPGSGASASMAAQAPRAAGGVRFDVLVHSDRALAASLGPSEVVRRFATLAGQMLCINTLKLEGSRLNAAAFTGADTDRLWVHDGTSDKLLAATSLLVLAIDAVAAAHATLVAKTICRVNSLSHVQCVWRSIEPSPLSSPASPPAAAGAKAASAAAPRVSGGSTGSAAGATAAATASRASGVEISESERKAVDAAASYITLSREYRFIDEVLRSAVTDFVRVDAESVDIFGPVVHLLDKCRALVPLTDESAPSAAGDAFAQPQQPQLGDSAPSAAPSTVAATPEQLALLPSEQDLLATLVPFHKGWLDALTSVVQRLRVYFSEGDGAFQVVLREYFGFLVDKVKKLHAFVTKHYARSASIKSKIVGPTSFWNEVTRLMA